MKSSDFPGRDRMEEAMICLEQGRLSAAQQIARDVLASAPTNHKAIHVLGIFALNSGNMPAAIKALSLLRVSRNQLTTFLSNTLTR